MDSLKFLLITLIAGSTVVGCQQDTTEAVSPQFSQPVTVAVESSARVGQDVTIQVDKIVDSRCPANVVCVRYGEAKVDFTLSQNTDRQSGGLCLGDCYGKGIRGRDTTTVKLGGQQYTIVLSEIQPYPRTDKTDAKQTAVLTVIKQ